MRFFSIPESTNNPYKPSSHGLLEMPPPSLLFQKRSSAVRGLSIAVTFKFATFLNPPPAPRLILNFETFLAPNFHVCVTHSCNDREHGPWIYELTYSREQSEKKSPGLWLKPTLLLSSKHLFFSYPGPRLTRTNIDKSTQPSIKEVPDHLSELGLVCRTPHYSLVYHTDLFSSLFFTWSTEPCARAPVPIPIPFLFRLKT